MSVIPAYEQETVISFERTDDKAIVYTSDTTMMTVLDKKVKEENSKWKLAETGKVDGVIVSKTYLTDKKLISFRTKFNNREYTEEERKVIGEILKQGRMNKKEKTINN